MRTAVTLALVLITAPTLGHAEPCERVERVAVWRDGKRAGTVCRADAAAQHLTVLDLGDDWLPPVFAPAPDGSVASYRDAYRALAQERFADAGVDADLARSDRYFELYGIEPTLTVVRSRLADDARHACHDAIDDAPLAATPAAIHEEPSATARLRIANVQALREELEYDRAKKHLADLDALAATDAYYRRALDRLTAGEAYLATIRTIQAHLACDGLFTVRPIAGGYTWQTSSAVAAFQRGVMLLPRETFNEETREALAESSRERDFRVALRVLRERVVATTSLIEDGTAGAGSELVLGRALDPEGTVRVRGHDPLDGAAPDLVSVATAAAATALGWLDPDATRAFLDAMAPDSSLVAVPLPELPTYHTAAMDLAIEIDRGDVWHDPVPRVRDVPRRPALIVYAIVDDRRIPLARWPTTIGGWQDQKLDGGVIKEWKESPVGHRVWRDLFVGPIWLPPVTTPDRELVRIADDHYVLSRAELGPSYRAAFGVIAFVHHVEAIEHGQVVLEDEGIRSHGTGNLASLATGASHGCHRLLGRNVLRLADFVLAHHDHVVHGDARTYYRRVVRYGGTFPVAIDSLGYRIELVPPIPVDVLPGRVHR